MQFKPSTSMPGNAGTPVDLEGLDPQQMEQWYKTQEMQAEAREQHLESRQMEAEDMDNEDVMEWDMDWKRRLASVGSECPDCWNDRCTCIPRKGRCQKRRRSVAVRKAMKLVPLKRLRTKTAPPIDTIGWQWR